MQVRKPFRAFTMSMLLVVFLASSLSCSESESPVTESLQWNPPPNTRAPTPEEFLHPAVASNDVIEVRRLLESGADPNMVPWAKDPALIVAVRSGNSQMVEVLLEAGANPDAQEFVGDSALIVAIRSGNSQMVQRLLQSGANPDAQDVFGDSALLVALELGYSGIVEALIRAGSEPDRATMEDHFGPGWMRYPGSLDLVKALLEGGMSPDTNDFIGNPLLVNAVVAQEPVLVQMLLDAGANPNAKDVFGSSALARAVSYEHVFRLDLTKVEPALYHGTLGGHENFRLFAYAATPRWRGRIPEDVRDGASVDTALLIALVIQKERIHADLRSEYDVEAAIPVLLELGADPNGLLITAARRGDRRIILRLLELGTNPYRSFQVETVGGDIEIVQALLDAGAKPGDALARAVAPVDVELADGPGSGRIGAPDANIQMVQALLQAGADPGAPGQNGDSPLVEAVFNYQFEIAELLIDAGITPALKTTGSDLELLLSTGVVSIGEGSMKAGDQWGQLVADSALASAGLASGLGRSFAGSFYGLADALPGTGTGGGVGGGVTDIIFGR